VSAHSESCPREEVIWMAGKKKGGKKGGKK
jgi:hypothetical protein